MDALRDLSTGRTHCTYRQTTIESEALQLRKLLELIAYSSLVSYQKAYRAVRSDAAKDWHAARIVRKIESINPEFYPIPIRGYTRKGWNRLRGGYLTRKQFERLYDRCGDMLHAKNPFGKGKSSLAFERDVPDYLTRIENLLSEHVVQLANSDEILHVIVPMDSKAETEVRYLVRAAG